MKHSKIYQIENSKLITIPLVTETVAAGFPSPAQGYEEERIDITDILVTNPVSTFYIRVKGNSMIDANINEGDILVVDRSLDAVHGNVVVAIIDGEFTVKTLFYKEGIVKLLPANPEYPEIFLSGESELNIWGVVKYTIHRNYL